MTRRHRRAGQAGEGKLGLIIALVIVGAIAYALFLVVPVRIDKAELSDFVETQGRLLVTHQMDEQQYLDSLVAEANKMGVSIGEEHIRIDSSETRVKVTIRWDKTHTLPGGKEWTQHLEIDKEIPRL